MSDVNITCMLLELVKLLPKSFSNEIKDVESDVLCLLKKGFILIQDEKSFPESSRILQIILDITWEELNTGHWSQVPDSKRMVYSFASLMKVIADLQKAKAGTKDQIKSGLEDALKTADLGLLLGSAFRKELTHAANLLSSAVYSAGESKTCMAPVGCSSLNDSAVKVATTPVRILKCPSIETFSAEHFYPRIPVKLTGCISHWPAMQRWKDFNYLLRVAGGRTIPVELGSKYTESDWSQKLMTLSDFILKYVITDRKTEIGYLAQHQLFNQVPELRDDIIVPDYCCCTDNQDDVTEEVDINAWFGPAGTVSPLHYDPKHNLLSQVIGSKIIVLYSPQTTEYLYPHDGRLLSNTAQVDPENPDYKTFPKYREAVAVQCVLNPGDMLYIPPTWWHYVRSLDASFSVSFWWT